MSTWNIIKEPFWFSLKNKKNKNQPFGLKLTIKKKVELEVFSIKKIKKKGKEINIMTKQRVDILSQSLDKNYIS